MSLFEFQSSTPKFCHPRVRQEFWELRERLEIDWPHSDMRVPAEELVWDRKGGSKQGDIPLGIDILGDDALRRMLWIRDAEEGLTKITKAPWSEKEGNWGARAMTSSTFFWPEIIAATWRILAINHPRDGHALQEGVLEDLRVGERSQGLSLPEDASLRNVIKEVLRQWRNKQLDAPVLVNTGRPIPDQNVTKG